MLKSQGVKFQSTLPIREETFYGDAHRRRREISIHSSHTGRDGRGQHLVPAPPDFNPLFPYGKRPPSRRIILRPSDFNPLFPYGKRRRTMTRPNCPTEISIHSSHTGRDAACGYLSAGDRDFNPLFPYGKRHERARSARRKYDISIHSSHTGRDSKRIQPFCTKSCCICTT